MQIRCVSNLEVNKKTTEALIELDRRCFPEISKEDEGDAESWMKIHKGCIGTVLFNEDTPIGYIDFVSLNERGVESFVRGEVQDGKLEGLINDSISTELKHSLYLVCIAIDPLYRGRRYSVLMWNEARKEMKKRNLKVKEIYATIWSKDGMRISQKHKGVEIGTDTIGHPLIRIEPDEEELIPSV